MENRTAAISIKYVEEALNAYWYRNLLRSARLIVCKEGFVEQIAEGTDDGIAEGESHDGFAEMGFYVHYWIGQ